jgi:hypothetical protein
MNFHHKQSATQPEKVTMTKDEAAALEKFAASSVKLHNDMQAIYDKFSVLVTRLELLDRKQNPPKTSAASNAAEVYPKSWDKYDY